MNLHLEPLLQLFDNPPKEDDAGKVIGPLNLILGEGIGLALLKNAIGNSFELIDEACKEEHDRGGNGKRLDAWATSKLGGQSHLLQIEIKNWSATAPGVKTLAPETPQHSQEIREYREKCWNNYFWDYNDYTAFLPAGDNINKVLRRMVLPSGYLEKDRKTVRPLLMLWAAMHPEGKKEALFKVKLPSTRTCNQEVDNFGGFKELWFFSMSSHIRNLHHQNISSIRVDKRLLEAPMNAIKKLSKDLDIWRGRFFDGL